MNSLPETQRAAATDFFTTIRSTPDGVFTAVPYSLEYQGELTEVSRLLSEAAALTRQPTLKSFLQNGRRRSSVRDRPRIRAARSMIARADRVQVP
jgi:hypothetical protein